ncbi:Aspartyl protease family protein 2 [Bienertia sinuspersici]
MTPKEAPLNDGDYLIKIALDTSCDLIWVQCTPDNNCIPQNSPPFDYNKSLTFQMIP